MTKRMLIDATHAEETRVVVLDGNRLEDFDVETSTKRQLKGNIYLAKVVRVEPSLQAAFVEYGGNRHGFLAFSEIHPDYYQIPVADRQRLLEMHAEEARREEEEEERAAAEEEARAHRGASAAERAPDAAMPAAIATETRTGSEEIEGEPEAGTDADAATEAASDSATDAASWTETQAASEADAAPAAEAHAAAEPEAPGDAPPPAAEAHAARDAQTGIAGEDLADSDQDADSAADDAPPPETVGGSEGEEAPAPRSANRYLRNYKIQEVIRRRQILLIQVVKEERGTKGAALTTYISLAGRFCVLMPNSPRGGGISRKITSAADRRRLKEITSEMEIPRGMGLIVRTAGAARPKAEIKRDCEYLMRMWDEIREHTLRSVAPALIYEEASLIKRAIRDVYSRDVDDIHVDGEEGWKAAHEFMRMLMPSHARKVQMWRDPTQTLFGHFQVEAQLDAMLSPTVQLRSGGYLVINQTEALVAIDVNSGRSTRERGIEETALRTNMEAADEVARQLRLRDLAGLIVIDFIDMEEAKNNRAVEKVLKDNLAKDRARIQMG
ncbi:MAG: ribonuclease E/G, partial [Rhodospirillales bacterium]|nr:ribonuclease E/G [Rhodospirillales bacterium]